VVSDLAGFYRDDNAAFCIEHPLCMAHTAVIQQAIDLQCYKSFIVNAMLVNASLLTLIFSSHRLSRSLCFWLALLLYCALGTTFEREGHKNGNGRDEWQSWRRQEMHNIRLILAMPGHMKHLNQPVAACRHSQSSASWVNVFEK